jgi:hypothetical protein
MEQFICYLSQIKWTELISALGTLAGVFIARTALNAWRNQKKADIHTGFLDRLTDEVHELTFQLTPALEFLKYIQISFKCHVPPGSPESEDIESGAIQYIQKHGIRDSREFRKYLDQCAPHVAKIRSLVAKGQAFGLESFQLCSTSCQAMTREYERLVALQVFLALEHNNWENELVLKSLRGMLTVDYDEIKQIYEKENIVYLQFVKANYDSIFKIT